MVVYEKVVLLCLWVGVLLGWQVLQMHKEGVDISKMLEEPQRRMLLRKELDKRLNDGKGESAPPPIHSPALDNMILDVPTSFGGLLIVAADAAPCQTSLDGKQCALLADGRLLRHCLEARCAALHCRNCCSMRAGMPCPCTEHGALGGVLLLLVVLLAWRGCCCLCCSGL